MANKKGGYQRTVKGETREFAKLAAKEAKGFGSAAVHLAGVLIGLTGTKSPKSKKK